MDNSRLRLTAVLAGAALALFAVTSSAQNTSTPTTSGSAAAPTADQSAAPQTGTTNTPTAQSAPSTGTDAGATIGTTSRTTTSATDVTTTSPTTTTFWLSPWGLVAIAVVAILILWAIFGRRDRTVVRDSYSSSTTTRPTNERIVAPRAASGTETTTRTTDTDTRM